MGLKSITFEGLNPVGRAKELHSLELTAYETDFILNTINGYLKDEKPDVDVIIFYPQWVRWKSSASGCEACKDLFSLLPNGDMLACSNLPVILGNILEDDFNDIWNSKLADYIRNKRFGGCNVCEFKEKCGGCRSRAYGTGNIFGSDPSCTLAYKNR
ncbi:SPASM domain-containing protein [Methanobacterium petrolearium]